MTTVLEMERDLTRKYTEEERDAMFDAYIEACETGNNAEADRLLQLMPIHPRMAKIVAKVMGREYLQAHFNITRANEAFGEDWLNGQ